MIKAASSIGGGQPLYKLSLCSFGIAPLPARYIFIFSIIFIGSGFAILIKVRFFFLGMEITQEAMPAICFGQGFPLRYFQEPGGKVNAHVISVKDQVDQQ